MKLKSAHITSYLSDKGGGIPVVMRELTRVQAKYLGAEQLVAGWREPEYDAGDDWGGAQLHSCIEPSLLKAYMQRPVLAGSDILKDVQIMHVHGLWTSASLFGLACQNKRKLPYVVSPHGMLDPWAMRNSAWKKRIAMSLFEREHLTKASCLHALCSAEADAIKAVGLCQRVEVIPNGVYLPNLLESEDEVSGRRKRMLFLGRLHPKKGLKVLIDSWAHNGNDWQILIAGWSQLGYADRVREAAKGKGLHCLDLSVEALCRGEGEDADVIFLGAVFAEQKDTLYRYADTFVLPSFSEGMPMTVLEAWSYGLPVLMTKYCNIPRGFEVGAAHELQIVQHNPKALRDSLQDFWSMNWNDTLTMGKRGRVLVEQEFTWEKVASDFINVYEDLIVSSL